MRLFRVVPVDTFKDDYVDCCTRGEPLPLKYSKLYLKILQAEEVGISMRLLRVTCDINDTTIICSASCYYSYSFSD